MEFIRCIDTMRCVINSVEAYEVSGPNRYARMDRNFYFPSESYLDNIEDTRDKSSGILMDRLMRFKDSENLKFVVWLDYD